MQDIGSSLPIRTFAGVAGNTGPADVVVGLFDANDVRVNPLTEAGFTAGIENQTAGLTAQMVSSTSGVTGAIAAQTAGLTAQMISDAAGVTAALHSELLAQTAGLTAQMITDTAGVTGAIADQTAGLTAQMVSDTAGITGALATQTAGLTAQMIADTAGITGSIQNINAKMSPLGQTAMAFSMPVVIASDQVVNVNIKSAVENQTIADFNAQDLAAGVDDSAASTYHDYVAPANGLVLESVWVGASGKCRCEVQVGPAGGPFVSKFVGFNSTSNPTFQINCGGYKVATAEVVRLVRKNTENALAQTIYTTIVGSVI